MTWEAISYWRPKSNTTAPAILHVSRPNRRTVVCTHATHVGLQQFPAVTRPAVHSGVERQFLWRCCAGEVEAHRRVDQGVRVSIR
jgi:hypothetical protein